MLSLRSPRFASALALGGLCVGLLSAPSSHASTYTNNCPAPESLVKGTTWHKHQLSNGVLLKEGKHKDDGGSGLVKMHVLKVDLTTPHLSVKPIEHKLSFAARLSYLATGVNHLVAATNTGYFSWGPPRVTGGALVDGGRPYLASTKNTTVVGFDKNGHAHSGTVHLVGSITGHKATEAVSALNTYSPAKGITIYNTRWGASNVVLPRDAIERMVTNNAVSTGYGTRTSPPTAGQYMIVARGSNAQTWLKNLKIGDAINLSMKQVSSVKGGLKQAYAVGKQLVSKGTATTSIRCRSAYKQPARTAVGYADKGKTLIILVVEDDPGIRSCSTCGYTPMHGLDAIQTARVMKNLGAKNAFLWDGSGSSELLAKIPGAADHANCINPDDGLSCRNYPADSAERPMPLGFGIFHHH